MHKHWKNASRPPRVPIGGGASCQTAVGPLVAASLHLHQVSCSLVIRSVHRCSQTQRAGANDEVRKTERVVSLTRGSSDSGFRLAVDPLG